LVWYLCFLKTWLGMRKTMKFVIYIRVTPIEWVQQEA